MAEQTVKKSLPARSEVPVEDTWKLEDIFTTDEDWEAEFKEVKSMIPRVAEFQGKLGESADTFFQLLTYQDELLMRIGKLYTYAHMRYDQDTTNSHYQGLDDRAKNRKGN